MDPTRTWIHVRVCSPWADTLTVPGRWRAHAEGTWLLLRADHYRTLRRIGCEEIERVYVRRTWRDGTPYLHGVTYCGRLLATTERVNMPPTVVLSPMPQPGPQPDHSPVTPDGPVRFEARRGCGCGGQR